MDPKSPQPPNPLWEHSHGEQPLEREWMRGCSMRGCEPGAGTEVKADPLLSVSRSQACPAACPAALPLSLASAALPVFKVLKLFSVCCRSLACSLLP